MSLSTVLRWEVAYSLPPVIEKTRSYQPQFVVTVPGCTRDDALAVVERLHPGASCHRCEAMGAVPSECAAQEQAPTPSGASPGHAASTPPQATPAGPDCRKELAWAEDLREGR